MLNIRKARVGDVYAILELVNYLSKSMTSLTREIF